MTLDEAIKHAEEVAETKERDLKVYESINEDRPLFKEEENECQKCAKKQRQLAEWLKELKQLREQTRWIPVSERLPEIKQHVLLSCYGRVIYGRMISEDGNSGYPIFEICDSVGEKRPIVLETTVHSEYTTSRITAWMPLHEPYKSEVDE